MLTDFQNKAMTAAPIEPAFVATIQAQVAQLRSDAVNQERELHEAQNALGVAKAEIDAALFAVSKGSSGRDLTPALFAQNSAQTRIVAAMEQLAKTRAQLGQETEALTEAEAREAARAAAALEAEIVGELQAFASEMVAFTQRCQTIETLRERARQVSQGLTPSVYEALAVNWGEVRAGSLDRLDLISKCVEMAEEPTTIVRTRARERALAGKADAERAKRLEREHAELKKGGPKPLIHDSFDMEYVVGIGLVTTRD